MGAGNVALVFARWGQLNHAPFRVLVYMAHRSLDSGNPPTFWGGREEIAIALGRPTPEPYGPEFEKMRNADINMTKKVIRELTQSGAITLTQAAGPGQNAVYALNLRASYPQDGGGTSGTPSGGTSGTRMVVPQVSNGGTSGTPLGGTGGTGLNTGVGGQDHPEPAGYAHTREGENSIHQYTGKFDAGSAMRYLLELPGDDMTLADEQARTEMPDANRDEQIIRAAEIAFTGQLHTGAPS